MLFKGTDKLGTVDYESEKVYLDSIEYLYDELGRESMKVNELNSRKNKYIKRNSF